MLLMCMKLNATVSVKRVQNKVWTNNVCKYLVYTFQLLEGRDRNTEIKASLKQ